MKFTDGAWLVRPGVRVHYATEVYEHEASPASIVALAPTRAIRHPGDTLQGPVLDVRLSSPLPNVIRVRLSHFTGALTPPTGVRLAVETDGLVAPILIVAGTAEARALHGASRVEDGPLGRRFRIEGPRAELMLA